MNTRWLDESIPYDGSQLRAHWILRTTGLVGDAAVAFRGPCAVSEAEMADLADLLDGPGIRGADMVHVLWECFDEASLTEAVWRQRVLSVLAAELLRDLGGPTARRDGDDLFVGDRKLSISIATRTAVSTLTHFAVNVSTAGTPVATAALEEFAVDPAEFGRGLLSRLRREVSSVASARAKVRAKGEA